MMTEQTDPGTPFRPDWASPPGDTILDLLEAHNWTRQELAERMGYSVEHVNQIIEAKVPLTESDAIQLQNVLGVPARFWLNREERYQQAERSEEPWHRPLWSRWLRINAAVFFGTCTPTKISRWCRFLRGDLYRRIDAISTASYFIIVIGYGISLFAWYKANYDVGSFEALVLWMVFAEIMLLATLFKNAAEFIPEILKKSSLARSLLNYVIPVVGIFIAVAFGQNLVSEVLFVSPSNARMATGFATAFYVGCSITACAIFLFFPHLAATAFIISAISSRPKPSNSLKDFSALLVLLAAFASTSYIACKPLDIEKNPYHKIMTGRIALDFDAMPPNTCLTEKDIKHHKNNGAFSVAIIPISTAVNEGYLIVAPASMPSNKRIRDYTQIDFEAYRPKIIDYVKCAKGDGGGFQKPKYESRAIFHLSSENLAIAD